MITSFLLWIWPLRFFLQGPIVKLNDSRWIKCCKWSRTAFFFIENVEKTWRGKHSTSTQSKNGRMVNEQEISLFTLPAPKQPAGADMCSQPSLLTVQWLVNGQNKYLISFTSTVGMWGGWAWAQNSELWIQFPAGPHDFCAFQVSCLCPGCADANSCMSLCSCGLVIPAGDLGPGTSCPSV